MRQVNTYSFRAECFCDVSEFLKHCTENYQASNLEALGEFQVKLELPYPDVLVTVRSDLPREFFLNSMRQVEDSHVMLETCCESSVYTGDRTYTGEPWPEGVKPHGRLAELNECDLTQLSN